MAHDFRGSPHNIVFPAKDELGNLPSSEGIEPLRWLLLKFKSLRLVVSRIGIGPESLLFWRLNFVSCFWFCKVVGIFPVKELNERSSILRFWDKKVGGSSPEKLLCWR